MRTKISMQTRIITGIIGITYGVIFAACQTTDQPPVSTQESSPIIVITEEAFVPESQPTSQEISATVPISGTVTIWHSWDDTYLPALVQIITNFQVIHPSVQFDVLYLPIENLFNRYQSEAQTGGGPGILLGPAEWGVPLFDQDLITNLLSLTDEDLLSRINSAAMDQVTYRDAILGLPYRIEGVILYRNRDIIPVSAETFDDLVASAQSVTRGEVIGADFERGFYFSGGHLNGIGGELIGEDGKPLFNNQFGIQWLQLLTDFESAGPAEYNSDRDLTLFKDGRVGYIIDGTWSINVLVEALGFEKLVVDPWPKYQGGVLAGYVQSNIMFMNSLVSDENLDATLEFMQYFVSPESQVILADVGYIPAVIDLQLIDEPMDRILTQVMIALQGGTAYPAIPEMELYIAPMDYALRSVFDAGITPEEALQIAEDDILSSLDAMEVVPTQGP